MPGVGDDIIGFDALDSTHAYGVGVYGWTYIYSPTLIGDVNLDWRRSPADVVLLLNFTFKGVPTSVPPADMDFNADCSVTTADVVLLIDGVFLASSRLQWGCTNP